MSEPGLDTPSLIVNIPSLDAMRGADDERAARVVAQADAHAAPNAARAVHLQRDAKSIS